MVHFIKARWELAMIRTVHRIVRFAFSVHLAIVFLWPIAASAADPDTNGSMNYYLPACRTLINHAARDKQSAFRAGECMGLIEATSIDALNSVFKACLPDDAITAEQLATYVVGWMELHPDLGKENFVVVAAMAMVEKWLAENDVGRRFPTCRAKARIADASHRRS
jgi:hypothetical protein